MPRKISTRQALLAALSSADTPLSGEALASQLQVSRTAVWKAARRLQQEGYAIYAHSGLGYRLLQKDLLTPQAVYAAAPALTAPIICLPTTDSTNRQLKAMAAEGAPHGTLLLAEEQTAGRGRLGRSFFSPAGQGVYMSLLLRPEAGEFPAPLQITTAAAVAVCRGVERLQGPALQIKWVNDLYYRQKKVCGILAEGISDLETGRLSAVVVGIGLNLTTPDAAFPPELQGRAAGLYPAGAAPFTRATLAGQIAAELLALAPEYRAAEEYRARSFLPGHWVTVSGNGPDYTARVIAVDEACRLVVEAGGRQQCLQQGEVSIRPAPMPGR